MANNTQKIAIISALILKNDKLYENFITFWLLLGVSHGQLVCRKTPPQPSPKQELNRIILRPLCVLGMRVFIDWSLWREN
jgi:hypothetical protein